MVAIPYLFLDLTPGHGNLLGESYWELRSPWRGGSWTLNTGPAPRSAVDVYSLSQILEAHPHPKYYLSRKACLGILRRAYERGKELPLQLKLALILQAGLMISDMTMSDSEIRAYHINQRDEDIDPHGVSGALMATQNVQMQTFVTGTPAAFAANQRDAVRDLHDVAGALGAQPGMKQQTFCLTPWDTQQTRVFVPEGKAPTLAGADGGGGRNPAGLLFTAGFCAGAGPSAGGIGYSEEISPTLKAAESGTNMVPSILCLNDQGGNSIEYMENISGALRAQEHGHQPLVLPDQPVLFENHGVDSRYTGPHPVSPTLSARAGTGGNNLPFALQTAETLCISGNTIDRQPRNGGNGLGCQEDISYTLTATDHHAVFSRQRVDVFRDDDVASTESARQCKDATDLVYQEVEWPLLIRRLTPLECERLQGFPDGWTDLPGASDSARYKALGNSVAIPCVEYIMRGIAMAAERPESVWAL